MTETPSAAVRRLSPPTSSAVTGRPPAPDIRAAPAGVTKAAQPVVILTVQAPEAVRSSTWTRTFAPGTLKLSPRLTGASASGGYTESSQQDSVCGWASSTWMGPLPDSVSLRTR